MAAIGRRGGRIGGKRRPKTITKEQRRKEAAKAPSRFRYPPAFLAPFQVVGAFRMAFGPAVYDDEVGLDSPVWGQDDGAIAHALAGLDAFGEVDFFGLGVGHWCHLRFNSESCEVSPAYNLLKTKTMAEREGFESA
jgi:hypothetical protein